VHAVLCNLGFLKGLEFLFDTDCGPSVRKYRILPSTTPSNWESPQKTKCLKFVSFYPATFKMYTLLLHLFWATQNTTTNVHQNVWNWKNNYSICINANLFQSYTLCYSQYNILLFTRIRAEFSSNVKHLLHN